MIKSLQIWQKIPKKFWVSRVCWVNKLLFIFLSSFLFFISYPNIFSIQGFPFFIFVFAVPLLDLLWEKSFKQRMLIALIWGLISFGLVVNWLTQMNAGGCFLLALALSLQPVIFAVLFRNDFKNKWVTVFYLSSVWALSEYLRSLLLDGFVWGISYSQSFNPHIVQWASWGGSYFISFIIFFINLCLFYLIRKRKIIWLLPVFIIALAVGFLKPAQMETSDTINICSLQPNFTPEQKLSADFIDNALETQIRLSRQCVEQHHPDLVVWPETAITDDIIRNPHINSLLREHILQSQTPHLIGSALLIDGKDWNSAVLLDENGDPSGVYHKHKLITLAERHFASGSMEDIFVIKKGNIRFGTVICSEDFYPGLFRKWMKYQPDFIAVLLNDGWLRSQAAYFLHAQISAMRAVEFGIPVVRSANSGVAGYFASDGQIKQLQNKEIINFSVNTVKGKTFYREFGDIFIGAVLIFVIIILLLTRLNKI